MVALHFCTTGNTFGVQPEARSQAGSLLQDRVSAAVSPLLSSTPSPNIRAAPLPPSPGQCVSEQSLLQGSAYLWVNSAPGQCVSLNNLCSQQDAGWGSWAPPRLSIRPGRTCVAGYWLQQIWPWNRDPLLALSMQLPLGLAGTLSFLNCGFLMAFLDHCR